METMKEPAKLDVLLAVYQSQRQEALQHRQNMFNAFSLTVAGFMVILAGVVSTSSLSCVLRWVVGLAVVVICLVVILFIRQQRRKTREGMSILLPIERELRLFERGEYLQDRSVLPSDFSTLPGTTMGLSHGDWYLAIWLAALAALVLITIVVV
jgi:FtsH-binding integral membrane protein